MDTYTDDPEIRAIRMCWQNGLTLSQASKRLKARYGIENNPKPESKWDQKNWFVFENNTKLIAEWRKMKRLFGCSSLPGAYLHGYRYRPPRVLTQQELNTPISNFVGSLTYGDWKGITGPGKQLRELLKSEKS